MFGFVTANLNELTRSQKDRYTAVYCGICRNIRAGSSNLCRCCLSYDMALLALVLMSLYEPEETVGNRACALHPIRPRPWTENEFTRYAADMNVALAYYNAVDDWCDDKKLSAKAAAAVLEPHLGPVKARYPRQCQGQLFVYREDLWQEDLFGMGMALGRFVYLTDAAVDYRLDVKKKKYNPFAAMGTDPDPARWEEYLVLAMARCTECFERLPLVQDKALMDNILYSGVWGNYRRKRKQEEDNDR